VGEMTDRREGTTRENLLEILDNVIHQLDFTKKMVIIMVFSFIIVVPIIAYIGLLSQSTAGVGVFIPIIGGAIFLVWLGVGIRQWIVISVWTQKYRIYKEVQKKVEESLDFEKSDEGKNSPD
jgi:energy-coupling factor transporter transmembrane protein EcfT